MLSNDAGMPVDFKSNGCGSGSFADFVPNTIYFLDITESCRIHDYAYLVGTTIEDKDSADREFLNNMIRLIDAKEAWYYPHWFARRRALKYYEAVHTLGGSAFWDKE